MYKVVKKSEAKIRKISENKIAINFITKEISKDISLAITEAYDFDENETSPYNRIYFVTGGELSLQFEKESITLTSGDSCFISKNTDYLMKGTFKAIVINQPAFGT